MTTPVGSATNGSSTPASNTTNSTNQLGTNTFLKLLVAQLKYQNPDSPADSSQFMAQTAQFSTVEKLTSMDQTMSSLLEGQQSLAAATMLGKQVTWAGGSGTVTAVHNTAAGPVLAVGKDAVSLSDVTEITSSTTGA